MAAVVHHGGAGTTAEGLRAGVPAVIVPFVFDQPFWGARVKALGLGPDPIPQKSLTADRLARAIRIAVTDAGMKQRASVMRRSHPRRGWHRQRSESHRTIFRNTHPRRVKVSRNDENRRRSVHRFTLSQDPAPDGRRRADGTPEAYRAWAGRVRYHPAREAIRQHKAQTGETLSFSAFFLACLGKAIDLNKHMHALSELAEPVDHLR